MIGSECSGSGESRSMEPTKTILMMAFSYNIIFISVTSSFMCTSIVLFIQFSNHGLAKGLKLLMLPHVIISFNMIVFIGLVCNNVTTM